VDEKDLRRTEAIIQSMTRQERTRPQIIDGSRRKRIARGSGTTVQDVNRMLRQFEQAREMLKRFSGKRGRLPMGMP
jgi:signal recognition particle subunit SRP54